LSRPLPDNFPAASVGNRRTAVLVNRKTAALRMEEPMNEGERRFWWGRTALVVVVYLTSWGLLQWLGRALEGWAEALSLALFMMLYVAASGILLPLNVGSKAGLRLREPSRGWRPWVGALLLIVALGAGLLGSGVLTELLATPPGWTVILKYMLLFLPMSLAVALVSFWLVPLTVLKRFGSGLGGTLTAVAAGGVVSFLGFWVDGLFGDPATALIMGFLGLLLTAAVVFLRSIWLVYPVFALLMLTNTLVEGKYHGVSWWALGVGFAVALAALIVGLRGGRKGVKKAVS